ncbi:MAG: hypothetical protein ABSC94_22715 [Polyangiaceae bacterium]|jgi:hypothetical protein
MLSRVRDVLYRAIASPRGDSLPPLRVSKDLARRLNAALGLPLATVEELTQRDEARARLKELRRAPSQGQALPVPAPVFVYFEEGRNVRELMRIEELLRAKAITWTRLDVRGDEATLDFVTRKAGCEADDLPVVFVAEYPVGTYPSLVAADVSGDLDRRVRGH